jgi:hypothetical protein
MALTITVGEQIADLKRLACKDHRPLRRKSPMKRLSMIAPIVFVSLLWVAMPLVAQREETAIAYGETVSGEITNRNFDALYTFSGEADDIVLIQMTRDESADFDPYLYLTTPDNQILAQNDDYYNLDSRIIARLPADGDYVIVATRRGERSGSGQGGFQVSLETVRAASPGTTLEGRAVYSEAPPTHVLYPGESGVFTIRYNHVRGDYFPGLVISKVTEGSYYEEDVAQLHGRGLRGGELTLEFERDAIYVLSIEQNYYDYPDNSGASAVYTINVAEPE